MNIINSRLLIQFGMICKMSFGSADGTVLFLFFVLLVMPEPNEPVTGSPNVILMQRLDPVLIIWLTALQMAAAH
jgi:hypothetical protein